MSIVVRPNSADSEEDDAELERLRVLKEHELGVRLGYDPDEGPYVPQTEE